MIHLCLTVLGVVNPAQGKTVSHAQLKKTKKETLEV